MVMEWFPRVTSGGGDVWAALLVSNKLRMEGCGGGAWMERVGCEWCLMLNSLRG